MMRNLGGMMKKVQDMQARMAEMQADMEDRHFVASAGREAVTATVTGKGRLVSLNISPAVCAPDDTQMLEDLVQTAVNEALDAAETAKSEMMAELTDGLPLPAGMKLPF